MERDEVGARRVDPYHLLFQGGQFYLLGYAHERKAIRVFRLTRIRGKVSYATKAEHDFHRPADFDPRAYANRADWQLGEERGVAEVLICERIAWQVERHFGRYGEIATGSRARRGGSEDGRDDLPHRLLQPARPDLLGARARRATRDCSVPRSLSSELQRRLELLEERHGEAPPRRRRRGSPSRARRGGARPDHRRPRARAGQAQGVGAAREERRRRGARQRGGDPSRALRAPGDAREHPDQGRARAGERVGGSRRCASACRSARRSCART